MGSITKRGKVYKAEIQRGKVREAKSFPTRAEARDWMVTREHELLEGAGAPGRETFAQAAEKWLAGGDRSRTDTTRLRAFCRLPWASLPLRKLTPETFSTFRDARLGDVAPGTVIREMTIIRTVLEYARGDLGWVKVNPIKGVRSPPEPPPRKRLISDAERDAVLAALGYPGDGVETIGQEVAVAFLLSLETGMRAGEICGLRPEDVVRNVARLPKTKNGDERDVPLSSAARALVDVIRGKRLLRIRKPQRGRLFHITPAVLDTTFRRAREAAGLDGFTFHDARATAVTRLAKRLDIHDLAKMIGHRDLNSLLIYYRESAASIAERLG